MKYPRATHKHRRPGILEVARRLVFYLTVSCCFGGVSFAYAAKQALVIGNASYENESVLVNTLNDAQDMKSTLVGMGFEVTYLQNQKTLSMKQAVNRFLETVQSSNEPVLLYFSGHGVQDSNGINYLLPVDADIHFESDMKTYGVSIKNILDQLQQRSDDAISLVVLDACRNNPFNTKKGGKGLSRVSPAEGTLVLYAASPNQTADDNPRERNGLFTKHLLAQLTKPGQDIEDAFDQVTRAVKIASKRKQVPYREGNLIGNYYLSGAPDAKLSLEQEYWQQCKTSMSMAMCQLYLDEYPTGRYHKLAAGRIAHLSEPESMQNQISVVRPDEEIENEEIQQTFTNHSESVNSMNGGTNGFDVKGEVTEFGDWTLFRNDDLGLCAAFPSTPGNYLIPIIESHNGEREILLVDTLAFTKLGINNILKKIISSKSLEASEFKQGEVEGCKLWINANNFAVNGRLDATTYWDPKPEFVTFKEDTMYFFEDNNQGFCRIPEKSDPVFFKKLESAFQRGETAITYYIEKNGQHELQKYPKWDYRYSMAGSSKAISRALNNCLQPKP